MQNAAPLSPMALVKRPLVSGEAICALTDIGAGGLAEEGDVVGVAAEGCDVAADPGDGGGLVHQAVVAGGVVGRLGGEFGEGEEAEDAEAVVHGDDDDAAMREELAVLAILGGAAGGEAAAVDPDHDGQAGGFLAGLGVVGRPDVEGEAVLAGAGVVEDHVGVAAGLDAVGAEVAARRGRSSIGRRAAADASGVRRPAAARRECLCRR